MTATGLPTDTERLKPPSRDDDSPLLPAGTAGRRSFPARVLRGADGDPGWARPALLGLLAATAVLYLVDLGASGYANSFYAAAAQAASVSWKALFFGSFDASSFITVDKPPAFLWVMGLSGRIFGFGSWSMVLPSQVSYSYGWI